MRLLAALLLVLHGALPGRAEDDAATVALNFQEVELPVLAKFVSEVTGRNFILDDRVRGKVTIISPTRITPDEAYVVFQSVLQVKGFSTVPSGAFVKIVPARDARETTVPTGVRRGDEVVTRIIALAHANATGLVPVLQPLVAKDGLLTAYPPTNSLVVIDSGANVERLAGLLHDLDVPASERSLEVIRLRFAAADELARRLREALSGGGSDDGGHGLRVVADARTNALVLSGPPDEVGHARAIATRLDQAPPPGSARVNVYRLKYADSDSLVRVLSSLLGLPPLPPPAPRPHGSSFMRSAARRAQGFGYDGSMGEPPAATATPPPTAEATPASASAVPLQAPVRLTADPATNSLIVSATPADWETLRTVIEQLDVRRRQVFVEAIILEATVEKMRALGVDFRVTGQSGDFVGLAQANLGGLGPLAGAVDSTSISGLLLAAASNQKVTLPNGQQIPAQTLLLTALEADSDLNVLSAPNIVTTDNEEAEIVVGRNVPFIASQATSSSNLNNLFTTIERQDVGITLRMTPQITGDDFVRLTLFEEVSDIDQRADVGNPNVVGPTTTVRSASTSVAARNGQTVVIGGLLADARQSTTRAVPYLGRIPVLGALFRHDDDRRAKTNLLVFLTPHIIGSDEQMAERSLEERERMRASLPPGLRRQPELSGPSWRPPGPTSPEGDTP